MMGFHCLRKLLLLSALVAGFINVSGHKTGGRGGEGQWGGGIVVREEKGRTKREVGPHLKEKKYRRLEHSIMVQADIRSRYVGWLLDKKYVVIVILACFLSQ